MMKRHLAAPLLVISLASLGGPEALAMPVDLANACGALHIAEIRPLIAAPRAVMSYRWWLDSVTNRVVSVSLLVTTAIGQRRYDGFSCHFRSDGSLGPGRASGSGDGGEDDHSGDNH